MSFRPQIRSRHPSHQPLRNLLNSFPFRSVIRLGSVTEYDDTIAKGGNRVELNSVSGVQFSSNKALMKTLFFTEGVTTAQWWQYQEGLGLYENGNLNGEVVNAADLPYPIVSKHIFGSRGTGNRKINNYSEFNTWLQDRDLSKYIFEKFYNYNREYRLHVSKNGCFYTNRKMLKAETPADKRWFRNDSNSNWIIEENELFDKPSNFDTIIAECQKALIALGLDFAAFDVRVQSATTKKDKQREEPKYIIIESNSAPSFGAGTLTAYINELPRLLEDKFNLLTNTTNNS